MSLFPSTITGRILDDGVTDAPVIELQGISAGQLATVLTAYTPLETTTANTADIGTNAAAIAALQGQVAALPAAPDLTPYALASDLAAAEGSIAANASGLVAVNTSLTQGLATKANQSALDALQVEVDGKSTPASVDLKLANHPTTAAMNSAVTSANNATLAQVATTYALKSVVDQLALDVAARQTAADVTQAIATALLPMASTSDLTAAVALRTTPADVSQLIATALLPFVHQTALDAALALRDGRLDAAEAVLAALQAAGYQTAGDLTTALLGYVTQTAYDAGQAIQDSRLDGHDASILALQNAGPYATGAELAALQLSLQSAIDGLLAEVATLGGATNLVNAPAWPGNITWDLLVGTNQIRNFHAVAPMGLGLVNDDWTLQLTCDAYSTAQTDALLLPKASESWVLAQLGGYSTAQQTSDAIAAALTNHFTRAEATANLVAFLAQANTYTDDQLGDYSTTAEMNQAISDALVPYGTIVQRDAAIAAALAAYYTSAQTDSAIAAAVATIDLTPYWTIAQVQAAITAALVPVTLSNGQNWNGGPTFNLLRGTNVLRNLSVAGALTASFQNLDDTILIESDSYARSETYTQLETGAAITAAIDALDLSQFQNETQVLALISGELGPYWDQTEVANYVGGQLSNYQTSSQVSSAISSALSSYDNSNEVDSKIVTALLDFSTSSEVTQEIADALSNVDLSAYYTSAQTDSLFYPRTELDSLLTATLLQYWTSGRTQSEIDDALAGSGFLDQAAGDARYLVRPPGAASGSIHQIVQNQFFPPIIKNLLLQPPLAGASILGNGSTLQITCDCYSKSESDSRYLSTSDFAPLDARYFVREPFPEGNGIFSMVQEAFTPRIIRSLLCQSPLSAQPILGNGSTLQISCDCWSKGQSDGRYPLIANFNSLGSTVTSIDNRLTTLENSGGVAPTADLTVNSVTAASFLDPELRSSAGDLQVQNALVTVRKEDGALLASFADGGISLDRDVTVAAASTLNATTADFAQFFVGSTAATGPFNSNSTITANGLITADGGLAVAGTATSDSVELTTELRSPIVKARPADDYLTITGGTQGIYVNTGAVYMGGALVADPGLVTTNSWLQLVGGTQGVRHQCETMQVTGNQSIVTAEVTNTSATGFARLRLLANGGIGGADLEVASSGGCTLASINQTISFTNVGGGFSSANVIIYPQSNQSLPGWMVATYGFTEASDARVKTNVRAIKHRDMVEIFDNLEPKLYDRSDSEQKDQVGFIAQEVQAAGKLGPLFTHATDEGFLTLNYQRMAVVLWGVCKDLQARVEKLEKKKRGKPD